MILQVLTEYGKRTEYRMLDKFMGTKEVTMETLSEGVLVLPGILLGKLEKEALDNLNRWMENSKNQLILTPAWKECNLKTLMNTSLDIKVKRGQTLEYKGITCEYKIDGAAQNVLVGNKQGKLAIHYRKNTGSGLLTVITLPVLDYRISNNLEVLRKVFAESIEKRVNYIESEEKTDQEPAITDAHLQMLMFISAGIMKEELLKESFKQHFNKELEIEQLRELIKDLTQEGFIESGEVSDKGKKLIKDKKLKIFIDVLKRGQRKDEW